ncbi:MAG: hypothetical protein NPIRA06_15930 [Nitrospirales bacterium]|nr:MAG: hypothetical protein NPIRA06_15930 [Nitrospirales bacterium]
MLSLDGISEEGKTNLCITLGFNWHVRKMLAHLEYGVWEVLTEDRVAVSATRVNVN